MGKYKARVSKGLQKLEVSMSTRMRGSASVRNIMLVSRRKRVRVSLSRIMRDTVSVSRTSRSTHCVSEQ